VRIGFVDHCYHKKTCSAEFFKQALFSGHVVEEWWDYSYEGGPGVDVHEIVARNYDLVIVWQVERVAAKLAALRGPEVVFVPMWDGCFSLRDDYWRSLDGIRIVSFCHLLHEKVRRLGGQSIYVQYFPEPSEVPQVMDFNTLRGFFWQRRHEVNWRHIAQLIEGTLFDRLHLHTALDPGIKVPVTLPAVARAASNITTSEWFECREDFYALLASSNVFFAPRVVEGIGISFLEAMAMGMCVVAVDDATMNEYITHGVSGLLWRATDPGPLDFSRAAELGRRARERAVIGRTSWLADLGRLEEFVSTPTRQIATSLHSYTRFRGGEINSIARRNVARRVLADEMARTPILKVADQGGLRTRGVVKCDRDDIPLVTIVTVTLNCADDFEATIRNVLNQDCPNLEVIVVDGGSTDGTIDLIRQYEPYLDLWISGADAGPYDAMNKAADLVNGRYVLFMNAGDWFIGDDAISRAFQYAPADADFVLGHHIYCRLDGVEELHKANDFEETWRRLRAGDLDGRWLSGVPCHQATFTRTALLREQRYDLRYRFAADHEFMYRQRQNNARFHHSDTVISVYTSGGFSWKNEVRCIEEWWEIAGRYGASKAAERFFLPIKRNMLAGKGRRNVAPLIRRLAARPRAWRTARELRCSGLFFERWYLETYPDVAATGMDPILHYVRHGARELRNPSPFFDTSFYLTQYHDAQKSGINPLLHYLRHGAAEGRAPNPWFDPDRHLPGGRAGRGASTLVDFIRWLGTAPLDDIIGQWPDGHPTPVSSQHRDSDSGG
jgi:glycosyltransferase involved in cell wall biosynthesis